ncbi:MAG: hypothetical protein EXS36_19480 [Pedosphaera sp.]|nr:hypothetical protein [Pedosphaera sp.]
MPDRADITSVDAIASFRASLVVYLGKARATIQEVTEDIQRTKTWLQADRRLHWEAEFKKRTRRLEAARQELFSIGLSNQGGTKGWHQMAVHRAEHAVRQAADKLERIRKWSRQFEDRADPLVKQVDKLHTLFTTEMLRATHQLGETLKTLEAYSGGSSAPAPATPEQHRSSDALLQSTNTPPASSTAPTSTPASTPAETATDSNTGPA